MMKLDGTRGRKFESFAFEVEYDDIRTKTHVRCRLARSGRCPWVYKCNSNQPANLDDRCLSHPHSFGEERGRDTDTAVGYWRRQRTPVSDTDTEAGRRGRCFLARRRLMIPYFLRPLASSLSCAPARPPKRAHPVLRPIAYSLPSLHRSHTSLPPSGRLCLSPSVLLPFAIHDDVEIALVEKRKMMIGQRTIAGPAEPNTSRKNGRSGRTREADTRIRGVLFWLAIDMRIGAASLSSGCSVVHFRRCLKRGVLSFSEISGRYELVRKKGRSFTSPHLLLFERALLAFWCAAHCDVAAYSSPSVCRSIMSIGGEPYRRGSTRPRTDTQTTRRNGKRQMSCHGYPWSIVVPLMSCHCQLRPDARRLLLLLLAACCLPYSGSTIPADRPGVIMNHEARSSST